MKFRKRTPEITSEQIQKTLASNLNFSSAEAYKLLRTNLSFSFPDDSGCKFIGVTSAVNAEGKSTTAINTAWILAKTGSKVLLLDADLRLPTIAKKLCIPQEPGVSNVVAGQIEAKDAIEQSELSENLYVLPSGSIPPNPYELVSSSKMKEIFQQFANEYDYVIVDLPPVNVVADAIVMSPLLNGIVMVVRQNYCTRTEVNSAVTQLKFADAKILGFILTDVDTVRRGYKRYGRYKYYYKSTKSDKTKSEK